MYLKDIWPSSAEIAETIEEAVQSDMFHKSYAEVFDGDERWNGLEVPTGELFAWDERSTYVRRPPFFDDLPAEPEPLEDIVDARVLAVLGDSVTTDHISPAGSIKRGGPAALYLNENHVEPRDFNSYGARRGNHEVMMRGTFANIRLRNQLVAGGRGPLPEGGVTLYLGRRRRGGDVDLRRRDALQGAAGSADRARRQGVRVGLVARLGREGHPAARGPRRDRRELRADPPLEPRRDGRAAAPVRGRRIASVARPHGHEKFTVTGLAGDDDVPRELTVAADEKQFPCTVRIDTPKEQRYYRHGGILQFVLRQLLAA